MWYYFTQKKSRRLAPSKTTRNGFIQSIQSTYLLLIHTNYIVNLFYVLFLMFRSKLLWFSLKFLKLRSNSYRVFFNHFRQRREKWPQIYGNHHYSKLSLKSQDKLPPRLLMEILCKKWLSAVLINNAVVFASSQDKETPLPWKGLLGKKL